MSRRYPRIRAQFTATLTLPENGTVLVCRTKDISHRGCFLDTAQLIPPGTRVLVAILDEDRGAAMEIEGQVMRCLKPGPDGLGRGIGVRFDKPSEEWSDFVSVQQKGRRPLTRPPRRLRILVVGDRARQRGAMALYVTSGWDVRFATDIEGAEDALAGVKLNAVIAENDLSDQRWQQVLATAKKHQPEARRIVRSALHGDAAPEPGHDELFHRVVDRDAGLEALLDALTADIGTHSGP